MKKGRRSNLKKERRQARQKNCMAGSSRPGQREPDRVGLLVDPADHPDVPTLLVEQRLKQSC
jgi:hypothetical protein